MTIEVHGPNGAVVDFPDGTAPDIVRSIMAKHFGGPPQGQAHGASSLPPIPPGFVLDQPGANYTRRLPPIPPGFVLDRQSYELPQPLSWSDVGSQALQNAPSSAVRFAKDVAQPFMHPIDTAEAVKNIGEGALEKTGLMSGHDEEPYADAVGKMLVDRYGSLENFKRTLAEDPVGVAGDLSLLLSGGGSAAARVPGLIGRVGKVAAEVGQAANPLRAVAGVARGVGKGVTEAIGGLGTHTGGESLRLAARAGYEGGDAAKAFQESMRGHAPMEDTVTDARNALSQIRAERGDAYRQGMSGVSSDPAVLDFAGIDKAVKQASIIKNFKGQSISPSTHEISDKITSAVNDWRALDPKEFHTVEGLDALKQKLGSIRDGTQYGTPERLAADRVYQAVHKTITDQAPEYAKVMKGYEQASKEIKEIERTLSLNPNAPVDTSLRKLQSILRDNVNTSYGHRRELAEYLTRAGAPHLMERLAGQSLKPWTARGLGKLGMQMGAELVGGGLLTAVGAPVIGMAAGLPFMSPRAMGEAAYYAGKAARPLKVVEYGLKKIASAIPKSQAAQLADLVRTNSRRGARIRGPLGNYGKAAVAFEASPGPPAIAKLLTAARNLSHNLVDAGIQVSPDQLIGATQNKPDQKGVRISEVPVTMN